MINTKMENKEIRQGFDWLCKAVTLEMNLGRPLAIMDHVMNDGEFWWASDGYRMHRVDMGGFGDVGTYKVISKAKGKVILEKDDIEFPKVREMIPKNPVKKEFVLVPEPDSITTAYTAIVRSMSETTTLDIRFVQDVLTDEFTVFFRDAGDPVEFLNHTKWALIMPRRV